MSFHKDQAGYIVSSEGYSVRRSGRNELEYRSKQMNATIAVEAGYDPQYFLTIYAFAAKKTDPVQADDALNDQDRRTLVEHVCASLKFENVRCDVEWQPKQ